MIYAIVIFAVLFVIHTLFAFVYLGIVMRRDFLRRRRILTLHKMNVLVRKCLVEYAPQHQF